MMEWKYDMDMRRPTNDANAPELPPVAATRSGKGGGLWKAVAIVLLIAGVFFITASAVRAAGALRADAAIKGKQYQALFLTNGQVYFGKLTHTNSSYVQLTDIYYLQVQQTVQPTDKTNTNNQQVSLAKLGGELHGPEDAMYVNKDQVLFWENLKTDGKVTAAIQDYKSKNK